MTNILQTHIETINKGFDSLDRNNFKEAINHLYKSTILMKNIYVCGNGASAAIAEHWACDFTKGCFSKDKDRSPRVISLSANIPLMTAIANDISYDEVYSFQLERLANFHDTLIVISSSGNSPNIIRAIQSAKNMNIMTIGLTGFDGGAAKDLVDISLHVDVQEYEATEDIHQAIMQVIAKELRVML